MGTNGYITFKHDRILSLVFGGIVWDGRDICV